MCDFNLFRSLKRKINKNQFLYYNLVFDDLLHLCNDYIQLFYVFILAI